MATDVNIWFGDFDSTEYTGNPAPQPNVRIYESGTFRVPVPVTKEIDIPGANYKSIVDSGAFSEATQEFTIMVKGKDDPDVGINCPETVAREIVTKIVEQNAGYNMFQVSHGADPSEGTSYAVVKDISITSESLDKSFYKIVVKFNRRPEVFINTSETSIRNGSIIFNPGFPCHPVITLGPVTHTSGNAVELDIMHADGSYSKIKFAKINADNDYSIVFDTETLSAEVVYASDPHVDTVSITYLVGDWKLKRGQNKFFLRGATAGSVDERRWTLFFS